MVFIWLTLSEGYNYISKSPAVICCYSRACSTSFFKKFPVGSFYYVKNDKFFWLDSTLFLFKKFWLATVLRETATLHFSRVFTAKYTISSRGNKHWRKKRKKIDGNKDHTTTYRSFIANLALQLGKPKFSVIKREKKKTLKMSTFQGTKLESIIWTNFFQSPWNEDTWLSVERGFRIAFTIVFKGGRKSGFPWTIPWDRFE